MTNLPAPDPNTLAAAPTGPTAPSARRRLALAVAVAGTLGIGGAAVSSQLASASAPVGETAAASAVADVVDDVELGEIDIDDFDWEAVDEAFEAYDSCLAEQLPELFGDDIEFDDIEFDDIDFDDIDMADNISVYVAGDEGEGEWTVLDLGDENSTVSITKTDGVVEITTQGDVEEVDLGDFEMSPEDEAAWNAEMEQFDAAHEACAELMPELDGFEDITFADDMFDDDMFDDAVIDAEG